MSLSEEIFYAIALKCVDGVGDVTAKNLISYCGGCKAVFNSSKKSLTKIPGIGQVTASALQNKAIFQQAEEEINFIEKNEIKCALYNDKSYPALLKQCKDGPFLLFTKGYWPDSKRLISIVGTRKVSEYGKDLCNSLVEGLDSYGVMVISGLAYGVDVTAHQASVRQGIPTIGVLGHGLDRLYPARHGSLVEKMMDSGGGVMSDFLSGTKPDRENFPKRNRIIAGMSEATVIVETAEKGGSMITAYIASSYNRDVMAFPGRVGDRNSRGCHLLIKKNVAGLIESTEDLAYALGWEKSQETGEIQRRLFIELNEDEERLMEAFGDVAELNFDDVLLKTNYTSGKMAGILLQLELKGLIRSLPGNRIKRL